MKKNAASLALASLVMLANSAGAQSAPLNPFSRALLTPEEIGAMAAQKSAAAPGPTDFAAPPPGADPSLGAVPPSRKFPNPARPKAVGPSDAAQLAQETPPSPTGAARPYAPAQQQAAMDPVSAAKPRFVEAPLANQYSLAFHASQGAQKESYYAEKYGSSGSGSPSASLSKEASAMLLPAVEQLKGRGVTQGKIDVEMNRLTPAEFARWAQEATR